MSAAGITYSRHVQLSLGSSQQTGSPIGDVLHCTYRDVYGPVLSEIDVGVFVRAHLHRSQGPHILPSRATGIPSLPVGSSRPLIGQSVRSSCPYRCHFGTNIHLVDHLSIRCIHWSIRLSIFYRKASWQRPCITHWTGSSTCRRIYILLRLPVFWAIGHLPDTSGSKAFATIYGFSLTYRSRSERLSSSAACSPASLSLPCLGQSLNRPGPVLQGSQERPRRMFG